MTEQLKELLREYAEEARVYEVRDVALSAARRRRVTRRFAVVAAALAVLALGGIVYALPRPVAINQPTVTPTPSPTPEGLNLPARILPQPQAPELPKTAVGPAVRLYWYYSKPEERTGYIQYLVAVDGSQYRLGPVGGEPTHRYELSPDGRWLVGSLGTEPPWGEVILRDLNAGTSVRISGNDRFWSPDGRYLAIERKKPNEEGPGRVAVVDTRHLDSAPASVDLRSFMGWQLMGVTATGDIALTSVDLDTTLRVMVIDRRTGGRVREASVDLSGMTTADERSRMAAAWIFAMSSYGVQFDGDGVFYLQLVMNNELLDPYAEYGDVLVIDLAGRRVRERIALPAPVVQGDVREDRRLLRVLPQGLLLSRSSTAPLDTSGGRLRAWELFDPATAHLTLVTDMSPLNPAPK
ncbi:hypothetical protein GCM10009682_40910 [Luedemannella flava]|uniref:Uncharacterized protein n=1 Tax=Luedemannella flava TaxID=349316 RepID=A0ABN2MAI6_9ACTN